MITKFALAQLYSELPERAILTDRYQKEPFESDAFTVMKELPGVVVLAETVEHVRSTLRICNECDIPLVTRGAGTGLSGGARPHREGVLLVLSKLNNILEVDPQACTATVEPGTTNLRISEAAKEYGLFYAPDPSSQIACSIGGNVAENAGGVHCLKYGMTLHNVIGLRVLTIEGDELVLGGKSYDAEGYDFLALIVGSEGMLGVVTEIIVKLLPIPAERHVLLGGFDDVEVAGNCVAGIIGAGVIPGGLEMMDELAVRAAEEFAQVGYPKDAKAVLLCELDGTEAEVASTTDKVAEVMKQFDASVIELATDPEQCERLWLGRKVAFPAAGRMATDFYCMDGTIPRYQIGPVLKAIAAMSERYKLGVMNVFHAGDGNLHPLILYDSSDKHQRETAEQFGAEILEYCISVGGTITGEHGVGVEKIDQMCSQFSLAEIEQFHRIRNVFDVSRNMNPGKAIPTLARCSELGGMHVQKGQVPFPELSRF